MAAITSAATGNFASGSTWVGGVAPTTGDTVVIANGHTVTVAANTPVLGSNASAVGHGVAVQSGGTLIVAATLNVNGYDTGSNKAVYVLAGGTLQRATGGNIVVTPVSTWQTVILNEGDFIWDGGTIESGEPWTFVERGQTLSDYSPAVKAILSPGVYIKFFPVGTTAASNSYTGVTCGPISNAAGNSVGAPFDNSFSVVSVTGNATYSPYNVLRQEVSSFTGLATTGDYFVDCKNGVVYYYQDEAKSKLSCVYTVKTHQWNGFGIQSTKNGASKFLLQNATIRRLGGNFGNHTSEYAQQSIFLSYRVNQAVDATKHGYVRNCSFEYCIIPLAVYNSVNTSSNKIDCSGNNFYWTPATGDNYGSACTYVGFSQHVDFSGSDFDTLQGTSNCVRASTGISFNNCTGKVCANSIIPYQNVVGSEAQNNVFEDTGGWRDAGGFQCRGATGAVNVYTGNSMRYGNRCGRVGSFMTVENNEFSQYQHHGFVAPAVVGFFTGIKIKKNIIRESQKTGDMSGGWTLGYNYTHWLDDIEIEGNTFDTGSRSIMFNDGEGTKVLGTRLRIWDNNLSNAYNGITQPASDATNQTKKQILRLDYNNEYGVTSPGNVKQGTPVKSGVEYNLDSSRNVKGIALFNPSAVNATGKALQLVVSGTPGTDFSMLLSWGGGTAVELVSAQGTATGGTGATTHSTPGTVIDSSKSWTTDAVRLDQGKIVSGTGAGQYFMVRTNNATTLTVMPNVEAGTFTAPAAGSVYIVLKSDVTLSDGTQTVQAGLYIPEVPLTVGTYTDTDITIVSNAVAVDPQYVSATNLTPTNSALATAGFGGTYIGALEPVNPDSTAPIISSLSAVATGATTATLTVTTDEGNGSIFFLLNDSATATEAAILAGLSQSVTATGEQAIDVTALDHNTTYYAHVLHKDAANNVSNILHSSAFKTNDLSITLDFPSTAPCSLLGYQVWSKLTVTDEEIAALWGA